LDSRTAILLDSAPMIVLLSFVTIHGCNSSSSGGKKITSSGAPLSPYLRIPSENTRKSVELSELQVPASGLGIEVFGPEDKRDDVRLRDAVDESSRCSVVATASVVIVGGGFGVGKEVLKERPRRLGVQRAASRAWGLCHRQSPYCDLFVTDTTTPGVTSTLPQWPPSPRESTTAVSAIMPTLNGFV